MAHYLISGPKLGEIGGIPLTMVGILVSIRFFSLSIAPVPQMSSCSTSSLIQWARPNQTFHYTTWLDNFFSPVAPLPHFEFVLTIGWISLGIIKVKDTLIISSCPNSYGLVIICNIYAGLFWTRVKSSLVAGP
jgi:hypothetical protein